MNNLRLHTHAIAELCKIHRVKSLYTFGYVVSGNYIMESEVDLIVDFSEINVEDYADNYFDLKFSIQSLLKRPVDLLEEKALKNPYFRENVSKQKRLVYRQ